MALLGLAAWMSYIRVFSAEPAQDWMVFYTAARGWLAGDPALLIDGQQLTDAINQRFSTWLAMPLHLHPWVYPPSFLLLFLPFAVPPPTASLVLFELAGLPAFLAAVSASFAAPRSRTIAIAALLLCPAAPFNAMTGQNALFTSALLVGGFAVLDRRPILAGVLLGLLSFKPQLWLMAPVALVAARRWRVLASMAAAALALAFASLAVFGADAWRAWLALMTGADDRFSAWQAAGRLGGMSMFASVRLLGAPEALASLLQLAATALAGIAVYGIFRRRAAGMLAVAALCAATMLAAPHASTSDAVLLGIAGCWYLFSLPEDARRPFDVLLAAALWACPLINPPEVFRVAAVTPLLVIVFLGRVAARVAGEHHLGAGDDRISSSGAGASGATPLARESFPAALGRGAGPTLII